MTQEQFKARREALNMTQAQLAEKMGVSIRSVKHWEAGTRKPRPTVEILLSQLKPGNK